MRKYRTPTDAEREELRTYQIKLDGKPAYLDGRAEAFVTDCDGNVHTFTWEAAYRVITKGYGCFVSTRHDDPK